MCLVVYRLNLNILQYHDIKYVCVYISITPVLMTYAGLKFNTEFSLNLFVSAEGIDT
jgi:hypothetical protein